MKRILVIGYGNQMREDSGIGRLAAEKLLETLRDPQVTILPCPHLDPELTHPISKADCVVFIAAAEYGCPGVISLTRVRPGAGPPASPFRRSNPSALLAACRSAYGRVPEAVALVVSGEHFDRGEGLSPAVAEALPLVVNRVRSLVERECRTEEDCREPEEEAIFVAEKGDAVSSVSGDDTSGAPSRPGVEGTSSRGGAIETHLRR